MNHTLRTVLASVGLLLVAARLHAGSKDKTLEIYWIDSEGGGSTLIVTPNDESVLIDTGNPGGRDSGRIIAAAKAAGLTKIDYMLLTHFHTDHFGGAAEVAKEIPFGTMYLRAVPTQDPDGRTTSPFLQQIKPFKEIPARREALKPGVAIPLKAIAGGPMLSLRCLAADRQFIEPTAAQKRNRNPLTGTGREKTLTPSDNDNSAVFVLEFGGFRFFEGGDLTWNFEANLVTPYNLAGVVDVYQTDHHGLERSNNPLLIQSLAPTVVVMNNGPKKGGEPGTFAAIKTAKTVRALYQVHQSYNIPEGDNAPSEFVANHDNFTGADAAKCPGNIIKMVVAADGQRYTISVPSSGHAKTYETRAK